MRLACFEIRNFKGLQELKLEWDDILVLIGENNCGKSSVIQALDWFPGGKKLADESLFCDRCCGEDCPVELIGHFTDLADFESKRSGASPDAERVGGAVCVSFASEDAHSAAWWASWPGSKRSGASPDAERVGDAGYASFASEDAHSAVWWTPWPSRLGEQEEWSIP